jgi:hypothetical protein
MPSSASLFDGVLQRIWSAFSIGKGKTWQISDRYRARRHGAIPVLQHHRLAFAHDGHAMGVQLEMLPIGFRQDAQRPPVDLTYLE